MRSTSYLPSCQAAAHPCAVPGLPDLNEGPAASASVFVGAVVQKMVTEAKRNGLLSAEEAASQVDAPNIQQQQGTRMGNWLTKEQARELLAVADSSTAQGKRDYAILALLFGCTLR